MSILLQRSVFLLAVVILQRSFLDVLWPSLEVPVLIVALVISISFVLGFTDGLVWVLTTIALYGLLGHTGMFPVLAIGIAYGTSFLSRRVPIEQHIQSSLILSLIASLAVSVCLVLLSVQQRAVFALPTFFANVVLAGLLFPAVFLPYRSRERRIRAGLMSEFRGVRT